MVLDAGNTMTEMDVTRQFMKMKLQVPHCTSRVSAGSCGVFKVNRGSLVTSRKHFRVSISTKLSQQAFQKGCSSPKFLELAVISSLSLNEYSLIGNAIFIIVYFFS